ncbi:DNA translocase FtsK [Actibacterium pelagium]|uniref:DNA translocase FtsK n=1 Tax=Actibacterium pelagium TaxID=2029103 RepID=A0A917AHZ2_9RHOB|nr:DNA translocase FtsK [Actibacterium pelagium]GGE53329.1 hypothetical protein GCM10011517_21340 [Actibacterium pelagium]
MASYHMKQRDPLLDSNTQAALEQKGRELMGLTLMGIGILVGMMLWSYVPDDPSWLSATDEPAANWLGRTGASLASPLYVIAGWGAWGIAVACFAWGLRFVMHRGSDRVLPRVLFAPIGFALISIYASTHVPPAGWTHSFGMGGLFGDTVLAALLTILPISATFGLKVLALILGVGMVAMMLFVLGFDRTELKSILRFSLISLITAYAQIRHWLGRGAAEAAQGAAALRERQRTRAEATMPSEPIVTRSEQTWDDEPVIEDAERPGLFARMPSLLRRAPEPELVERELPEAALHTESPSDERIKEKINDVIKNRVRRAKGPQPMRIEPSLSPDATTVARAEPQLTRDAAPVMDAPIAEEPMLSADTDYAEDTSIDEAQAYAAAPRPEYTPPPVLQPRKVVQHPPKKAPQPSKQAQAEAQPTLFAESSSDYELPPLNLLANPVSIERHHLSDEALEENARMLETVLDDYGVKGEIVSVRPGPVVTMYELEPAPGLKASRVIGLADDIARSMSALAARVSTVPGRSVIGIELPNAHREKVVLREILSARAFGDGKQTLPLALGKDIGGDPIVANLAKMPHLLIAGTTGSGKSVAINTMILSLLYKLTPEECRLIMIDPKMLELSVYDGIPHLLSPVVTDPKKAVVALKWVVGEMEERYRKMSKMGVRNIDGYNGRVRDALKKGEMFSRTVQTGFDDETGDPIFETEEFAPELLPYIVVIVDEMADLMMVAGKEIEACIQRLAQMARASGIHLIMATQRPSVDVITGTIKANFPTRISFQVTSKVDSRTILGEMGAEQLLGMGDMLYMAGGGKITRCHGPFVSDEEVEEIVNHLKSFGPPEYMSGVVEGPDDDKESDIDLVLGLGGNTNGEDALYDQAVGIVIKDRKCSTSYIQRKLAIGYNKAARLVEQMEDQGVVSSANHVGKREILVPEQ